MFNSLRSAGSVPGVIVLVLCGLSFLAGRFIQQSGDLPSPNDVSSLGVPHARVYPQLVDLGPMLRILQAATHSRRKLSLVVPEETTIAKKPTTEEGSMPAPVNPLDTVQLEQYLLESSGLLKLRPPLPPAKSGDNFYHAIPFQVIQAR
jgi:prolyl 4-hydroxylase